MTDSARKTKMISLRISEVEYEVLKRHYCTYGARNISDLARLALQRIMTAPADQEDDFACRLSQLDKRVHTLEFHVSRILKRKE